MRRLALALAAGLAMGLAGCGDQRSAPSGGAQWIEESSAPMNQAAPEMAASEAIQDGGAAAGRAQGQDEAQNDRGATGGFYLAYRYGLGLAVPGERLASVMDGHAQACTAAGPATCQLISATRQGDPDEYISGAIQLRARPDWLRTFMGQVEASTDASGGEVRERSTTTEDLTRQIVDTEARLAALRTLRDRLQQILASRPGRLADLLEVERELARVQGELDSLTSTLAVLRQRVDMSELTIGYQMQDRAVTPRTFEPIGEAASGFLRVASEGVAAIITMIAALLPWAVLIAFIAWLWRRLGVGRDWRWPWRRRRVQAEDAGKPAPSPATE